MTAFLDVDGCLADFETACCELFGTTPEALNKRRPAGEWDFVPFLGFPKDSPKFWEAIEERGAAFWAGLKVLPKAFELVAFCERLFGPVCLMTSPPRAPNAVAGKVAWIREHFPAYARRFAVTPCKHYFANAGILVDDSDENVNKFRQAGGTAYVYPTYGNSMHRFADYPTVQAMEASIRCARDAVS